MKKANKTPKANKDSKKAIIYYYFTLKVWYLKAVSSQFSQHTFLWKMKGMVENRFYSLSHREHHKIQNSTELYKTTTFLFLTRKYYKGGLGFIFRHFTIILKKFTYAPEIGSLNVNIIWLQAKKSNILPRSQTVFRKPNKRLKSQSR